MSTPTMLFICLHGSAKSLIAAEHFNRLARTRGLAWRAESAGLEPDVEVPSLVIKGLADDGIDVEHYTPVPVTSELIVSASHVVSCGFELPSGLARGTAVEMWDDLPLVSEGFAHARDVIVGRLERLVARLS